MKRIFILVAVSLFLCSTASALQDGVGESTEEGSSKKEDTKNRRNFSGVSAAHVRANRSLFL